MISVIVPVYNVENVLHYCIDSILNQTYKDFELILVDDGSTDKSGRICDEYADKDSRIRVFHKENGGVSSARNVGIELASGEFICFVDSDDFLDKAYLESLLSLKKRYPDYDNVWCGFQIVNGYQSFAILQKVVYETERNITESSVKEIMTLHDKWLDSGPCCKLYDRELIVQNNLLFSEELSLGEDLFFNFQYLDFTNGRIVILNECLYNYEKSNEASLTSKFHNDLFEKYKQIHSILYDCLVKWHCDNEQFVRYYNSCFYIYEFVLRNTFHKESSIKYKYQYNNQILKSVEFMNTISNSNCFIHPLFRFGYKTCSYRMIRIMERIIGLVKICRKVK